EIDGAVSTEQDPQQDLEVHAELGAAPHEADAVDDLVPRCALVLGAGDRDGVAAFDQAARHRLDVAFGPAALGVAGVTPVAHQDVHSGTPLSGFSGPLPDSLPASHKTLDMFCE